MNIYLLNAPFKPNFVRCGRWQGVAARGGTLYYPIWLAYATGLLEQSGHNVKLVDAIAEKWNIEEVIRDTTEFQPNIIVLDSNFSSLNNDILIANILKKHTNAITILVGPPTSQYPEVILRKGVDIVARFEYDYTLKDVSEAIKYKKSLKDIEGISFIENGIIHHNNKRPFTTSSELDSLPFVSMIYKKHLKIENYFLNHAYYPMVQIFTTRGCPNQCTFCSWPVTLMGRTYRGRSIPNIVDEFEYIVQTMPEVKEIFIEDDSFTINKKRVMEFCKEIQNRDIRINWSCQSRATLDYETMKSMQEAGCRLLDVGYETGNDDILQNIKKGTTVKQLRMFSENAKKARIKILADFVIGFPGETKETVSNTLNFIKEIKPDLLQIAVATPMPGTEFYSWANKKSYLLDDDLENSIDNDGFQKCIISYPELSSEEISKIIDKSLMRYYFSKPYISIVLKKILNTNGIDEMKIVFRSAIALLIYFKKKIRMIWAL